MTLHHVLPTLLAAAAFAGASAPAAFAAPPRDSTPRPRLAPPHTELVAVLPTGGARTGTAASPVALV